ncbi:MAG: response regulator transcription factor [Bacteroidota bacterium]|nr:response regulator transcription factor [Bacteroidota bacterium]
MKILVVEDEKNLAGSIEAYLLQEGYICECAASYRVAEDKLVTSSYDCIVLDITLPDGNGLNLIQTVKEFRPETSIIILSAKNSLDDKLNGLGLGADDYLTKPFHLTELNARIKSIIRRRNFQGRKEIHINEILIHPEDGIVLVNGQQLTLTKKEFELLVFMSSNTNRVLTKEAIAERLWGEEMDMADSFDFIYTHVKNLRRKLIEKGSVDYIKTVYGMGYKFTTA